VIAAVGGPCGWPLELLPLAAAKRSESGWSRLEVAEPDVVASRFVEDGVRGSACVPSLAPEEPLGLVTDIARAPR